jgi:hypothetical protein
MVLKLTAAVCGLFLLGFGMTGALKAPQEYIQDRSIASLSTTNKKPREDAGEGSGKDHRLSWDEYESYASNLIVYTFDEVMIRRRIYA